MAETATYQCPNCNGRLSYNSANSRLTCEFCGSSFTPEEVEQLYAAKQERADAKAAFERREKIAAILAENGVAPTRGDVMDAAIAAYDAAIKEGKSASEAAAAAMAVAGGTASPGAHGAGGAHAKPGMSAAAASTVDATRVDPRAPLTGDPIKDYLAQSKQAGFDTEGLRAYNCPACGAQLMVDQVTAVTSCPYCGNNAIVPGQLSDVLKPDYVIPFKYDKNAAIAALNSYYGGKPLLPNDFTANNHLEEVQGVYVPFWLYSGQAVGDVTFNGRNIRTWSDSKNMYTETDHFLLHRKGAMSFARVPVDGSTKMPDAHMDAIEPYDYSEMVPFSMAYLPGYVTDRYDLDVEQCDDRARKRVSNTCTEEMYSTAVGFMETDVAHSSTDVNWSNIAYALLPVWMLHTRWNGEDYLFAMNGQTGKLIGDLPIDGGKVRKRFILTFLPLAAIIAAVVFFVFGF